jgi:hypothetical protein
VVAAVVVVVDMAHLRQFLARFGGLQSLEGPPQAAPRSNPELYRGMIVGESDFDNARHERGQ